MEDLYTANHLDLPRQKLSFDIFAFFFLVAIKVKLSNKNILFGIIIVVSTLAISKN